MFLLRQFFGLFKLFDIAFRSMGINRSVICFLTYMYYISYVLESQKRRREVCHNVTTVPYNVKMFKPLAYSAPQTAVNNARTAKSIAVDVFRNVWAVEYAELMAK